MKRRIGLTYILIAVAAASLLYGFINHKQDQQPLTMQEFNRRVSAGPKMTLVYFNASWCSVCAKMKPTIDQIELEYKSTIDVLRVDADRDKEVVKEFEIDALPVLILYRYGTREWVYAGLIDKKTLKDKIDTFQ
jgi:thioredoxin-like negative regulator of GroEL